jgi:polar amino acid transport system substrate-binding protein
MGTDIATGNAIAQAMGVKAQWVDIGFDGLIAALNGNKCDAIMAEMANKASRRKVVDFVNYGSVGNILMTSKKNPVTIKSSTSLLELSGKTAATQVGTFPADLLAAANKQLKAEGKPPINIVLLQNQADEVLSLATGKTDVVIDTATAIGYYITLHPTQFELASPPLNLIPIGIATRKNDKPLHNAIQKAVANLYSSGQLCTILKQWNVQSIALVPHKC